MQNIEAVELTQIKRAQTEYAISSLLGGRWSPRAFADKLMNHAAIGSLFEAARWSASGSNGQPWFFIIASRENPEEFERLLACISPFNAEWAKDAPLLGIGVAQVIRDDGKPNRLAFYDLGLAVQNLVIQAATMDIFVHQMGGFSIEKARETFAIPDTHEPGAAFAIGYRGDPAMLSERNLEREIAPRTRKPLDEFVFTGKWGKTSPLLEG